MRLTCPNCDTDYDVPDGMVPAAGRHVQCTACHTRWFVRGSAAPAPSEEAILTRLEARSPRPEFGTPSVAPVVPLRPPKPEVPTSAPPASIPEPAPAEPPVRLAPRRLDLSPPPAAPAERPPAPAPAGGGRFALGLATALFLFVLALAAYDFRRDIAASLPQAAPALTAYHAAIDDLRNWIENHLAPARRQANGG